MTQDKPTLTEDDIRVRSYFDEISFEGLQINTENPEQLKQQILTAVDEYPKLKVEHEKTVELYVKNTNILLKLKAENEELSKQLFDKEQQRLELTNPKEKECPVCRSYAKYFDREYGEAYCAYHEKHICVCGHLHKSDEVECEKKCGCNNYIAKAYLKELQQENESLRQLKQRVEDRIKIHQTSLEQIRKITPQNEKEQMFMACLEDSTKELQQLLKGDTNASSS